MLVMLLRVCILTTVGIKPVTQSIMLGYIDISKELDSVKKYHQLEQTCIVAYRCHKKIHKIFIYFFNFYLFIFLIFKNNFI